MILVNSRYEDGEVEYVLNPRTNETVATVFRAALEDEEVPRDRLWYWRDGDRLDALSEQFYGDSAQWYRILDANPDIINPLSITPGTALRIP
jgi:nucleoid-associated protein YgaU